MSVLFNILKSKISGIKNPFIRLNIMQQDKLSITVIILFSLILTTLIALSHKTKNATELYSLQNKRNESILQKVNEIYESVQTLEANPTNTRQQRTALENLQNNIISIKNSINSTAKSTDIQKISGQLTSVKEDIDSKIIDLKRVVSQNNDSKEYLDPTLLPFQVIAVDSIAGQSYASVDYENHVLPLAVGDLLAGWRVIYADYDTEIIELINAKNQHVKINMRGT